MVASSNIFAISSSCDIAFISRDAVLYSRASSTNVVGGQFRRVALHRLVSLLVSWIYVLYMYVVEPDLRDHSTPYGDFSAQTDYEPIY